MTLRSPRLPNNLYEDLQVVVYRQGPFRKERPLLFDPLEPLRRESVVCDRCRV
jgi:hypothetical protein